MTTKDKLMELVIQKSPMLGAYKSVVAMTISEVLRDLKVVNGETPVKGVDYFTPEEKTAWISMIANLVLKEVRANGPKDGEPPSDARISALIRPLIPKPQNGYTPIKGKDYMTESDKAQMVKDVLAMMPIVPQPLTLDEIASHVTKGIKPHNPQEVIKAILADPYLRLLLHGGGSSSSSATSRLLFETPTGTIDGVNTIYTVINTPVYIVVDGQQKFTTLHFTYVAPTITIIDGAPPVQFIRSAYNSA